MKTDNRHHQLIAATPRSPIAWPTSALAAALLSVGMGSALAAPGTPGVPQANAPIFIEDFDNTAGQPAVPAGQSLSLDEYVSVNKDIHNNPVAYTAAGIAYNGTPAVSGVTRADPPAVPFWLNKNFCNGMWLSSQTAIPTGSLTASEYDPAGTGNADNQDLAYCMGTFGGKRAVAWGYLQQLATALGQLTNGGTAAANAGNHAIAAFTVTRTNRNDPNVPLVQLQMKQPIAMPAGGRFVTFSVAMAAMSCKGNSVDPAVDFYLIQDVTGNTSDLSTSNSNLIKLNNTPANPCSDPTATSYGSIKAAQVFGDKPLLYTGSSVAMQFVNRSSATNGNDGAFDKIQILDVTPQLDKTYATGTTPLANGGTTTLTFTVTNTPELAEKSGWSLADTLPVGLTVAATPNLKNSCGGTTTVAATAGGNTVSVSNGQLAAGVASCEVSVDVTAQFPNPMPALQTLFNSPGAAPAPGVVTSVGLNPPNPAQLLVAPAVDLLATGATSQTVGKGTPVTFNTSCTNAGPDLANPATCVVSGIPADATNVSNVCTPSPTSLVPGGVISCVTTFTPNTPGVVTLTTTADSGSLDTNPANNAADSQLLVRPLADMQVPPSTAITTKVNTPVTVTTTCKNAGPDIAEAADCKVSGAPTGATTVCTPTPPISALAVGAEISCVTSFTPTTPGVVTLVTTATSTTADPDPSNNTRPTPVTVTTLLADMQASAPTTVASTPGTPVSVTSLCTNAGPDAADAATCTVSGAPADATTVCTPTPPITSLAVGSAISCVTSFTPKDTTPVVLTTTAASTTADPNTTNNVAETKVGGVVEATAVPTLGEWALLLLASLVGGVAALRLRRGARQV